MKPLEIKSIGFKCPDYQDAEWWPREASIFLLWTTFAGMVGSWVISGGLLFVTELEQFRILNFIFWVYLMLWTWLQCFGLDLMLKEIENE